jgi:hypothetical protein
MTTRSPHVRRRRIRGEKGYILAMTGLLLVPLVVFTAFGVDLGAWYAQSAKQQRAVDAASLAGVVQLPTQSNATAAALDALTANGYNCNGAGLVLGTAPTASQPCMYQFPAAAGQEMSIYLYSAATQYFSSIALKGESLSRSATAVYNLHIPLGSPNNAFGNDPTRSGAQPNLWAAIQGPFSRHQDGDPYETMCTTDTETQSTCATNWTSTNPTGGPPNPAATPQNTAYDKNGYIWAIEVKQANVPVTVAIYDPNIDQTGAPLYESNTTSPFNTSYELFNTTGSNANVSEDPSLSMNGKCTTGPGYRVFTNPNNSSTDPFKQAWYSLCTFTPSQVGIYPLQVKTSNIPNVLDSGTGWNAYSVRATVASGTQPQVYALNDMSIWTAQPGTTASFYLANIGQQYAGHTLVVDLYDPGDGNGPDAFTMRFVPPPSGLGIVPTGSGSIGCNYNLTPSPTFAPATPDSSSNCQITTKVAGSSSGVYNGNWLRVKITLPSTYTCSTDCWWWINYTLGTGSSTPTDRTTWVVNVLGDPVHLIQ